MTRAWTPEQLDALEKPVKRARVGKAVKGGPTERVIQRGIVKGLRERHLRVIHIPNGGQYTGDSIARLRMAMAKRMDGEVAGFPDLLVLRPLKRGGPEIGLLEVKRAGGVLSERQVATLAHLEADGFKAAVVTSLDEALAALRSWGWM
jgi:hypothetical protein